MRTHALTTAASLECPAVRSTRPARYHHRVNNVLRPEDSNGLEPMRANEGNGNTVHLCWR